LRIGAVSALILFAPVLLPSRAAVADETLRSSASTTPRAKDAVELEGTLEILHEDREDGSSQYYHVLSMDDGTRLPLEGVTPGRDLLTGDRVRVKGSRSGEALRLQAPNASASTRAALEVLAFAPLSNTVGVQKTLLILVNFSNDPSKPYTIDQAKTGYAALDGWFREVSYQQTSLAIDAVGWYTLPLTNGSCDPFVIQSRARQAATAAGVNLSTYVRQVFAFPFNATCQFAGMATVGGAPSSVWINGNTNTGILAHEFGHTLGLYHSHALNCHPTVVTAPCSVVEYGDGIDVMGAGGFGHYNAFQKQRLGWLDYNLSPPITTVPSSGAYTIDAYEMPGTAPKALKIARGTTGQAFFVELRRPVGWDAYLYRTGVFIHLASVNQPDSSQLLDMTPGTAPLSDDAFLDVGKSFTDPVSGVTLTTLSVSSTSATIMVEMDADTLCTRSAPSVTASPGQSPAVQSGTAVTYTVSVTNTDTAGCSAASFTLQATAPTGWQKSFGVSSVTTNPGATASTTLRITSASVPTGAYTILSAATSTTDSTLSDSTAMVYNVASGGGTGTPGTFSDTFDRPDSPALDNGWSVMTGSLMIQSGEARNQPTTTFSLAVQPGLMGATQMVEARFASTNNNSAPRFGVVVRYQNPQNYYICYRQVGGSSVVRIAKVQNGKETVLKSVGIANPTLNAFSKLSCQASGSTLTLLVDGVTKASTSNSTFTTGGTGYTISTKTGSSHRADNFSATAQ
jgi:hypothetical protein